MPDRWSNSEERVIGLYCAAVAVSVAVLFGGLALQDNLHPAPPSAGPPFGTVEYGFVLLTSFLLVFLAGLVPFVLGLAVFRWAGIDQPVWYGAYGSATGLLLGLLFKDLGVGLLMPAVAGGAGGSAFFFLEAWLSREP